MLTPTRRMFLQTGLFLKLGRSTWGSPEWVEPCRSVVLFYEKSRPPEWLDELRGEVLHTLGGPCDGPACAVITTPDHNEARRLIDAGVRFVEVQVNNLADKQSCNVMLWEYPTMVCIAPRSVNPIRRALGLA